MSFSLAWLSSTEASFKDPSRVGGGGSRFWIKPACRIGPLSANKCGAGDTDLLSEL